MLNNCFSTVNYLKKALDGTYLRNEAISNNISNVNTPGYKKSKVEFEDMLKNETKDDNIRLNVTNKEHITFLNKSLKFQSIIEKEESYSMRKDGNNVNIDTEMADLAKNTIMYNALIRQVSDKFSQIRTVINEGRK